jgi:TorA maturation chaperone TorD
MSARPAAIALRTVRTPSEEDFARARWYAFLGRVFAQAPDSALLGRIARDAQADEDGTTLGAAWGALARASASAQADAVAAEHDRLFIGVGRAPVAVHASWYLAGFLHERPLADLREWLARAGLARRDEASRTEDHLASLCEAMAELAVCDDPQAPALQRELFERFLAPCYPRLAQAVDAAEGADWYRPAAALLLTFLDIERQAFDFDD